MKEKSTGVRKDVQVQILSSALFYIKRGIPLWIGYSFSHIKQVSFSFSGVKSPLQLGHAKISKSFLLIMLKYS